MKAGVLSFALFATACGKTDVTCQSIGDVVLEAHAGAVQSDGSVTIYGGVRFEPIAGPTDGSVFERAVHAVYVANIEVQPGTNDFNYRTWSISIAADRLAAFAQTGSDGSTTATLPVRVYLDGNCTYDAPPDLQPTIKIPEGSGAGSGSGSGSAH